MTSDEEFLVEIRKDFLNEITLLLEETDQCYLNLENPTTRKDELSKIFRVAHSLKGGGQAVGFVDLSKFAHVVEDLLSVLRVYPQRVDTQIISLLLLCGDAFKTRVSMLKADEPTAWDVSVLENEVKAATAAISTTTNEPENQPLGATIQTLSSLKGHDDKPEKNQNSSFNTIRIDAARVENMLDLVGELVVIKSQVLNGCGEHPSDLKLNAIASQLDKAVRELQDKTLSMRMTPLKGLFLKTQRVIRDLSVKLDKEIVFHMKGEDTEIDRSIVELLSDPLIHIARNSLDHGMEDRARRVAVGKGEVGTIRLSAQQQGGRVVIEISDDGAGINKSKVLKKAIEKGLIPENQNLNAIPESEIFKLIFEAGFSTAEKITDISGRGVGMDVVKTNVEKMKGTIEIASVEGQGTTISLSLPLTTSVSDGMIVKIKNANYVLPMDCILELIKDRNQVLVSLRDGEVAISHRNMIYPILDLDSALAGKSASCKEKLDEKTLILLQAGPTQMMLAVDAVLEQTQVVLKPLTDTFKQVKGVSGAAILGDGKVALVINPYGLGLQQKSNLRKQTSGSIDVGAKSVGSG